MGTVARKPSRAGQETRDRIIDAALATVRDEGVAGASVRTIARTGQFNQALIFYHFGSVEELLLAALERANDRRIGRFRGRLDEVEHVGDLVQIAVDLHDDRSDCDHPALVAIIAGWSADAEVARRMTEILQPWDELVEGALRRCLAGTPLGSLVSTADLAHGITCLFLGVELMSRLDPTDDRAESLLSSLAALASLAGPMLQGLGAGTGAGIGSGGST